MTQVKNNMSNAINSNKQLFEQMQYASTPKIKSGVELMPSIQKDEFIYYNDPEAIEKEKKKKTSKKILLGTTALAGVAGIAATTVAIIKGKHYKNIDMGKTKEGLSKVVKFLENTGSNFSNIRDDITTKAVDAVANFKFTKNSDFRPFKFVEFLKEKSLGIYDYFLETIGKSKYNNAYGELLRLQKEGKLASNIEIPKFEDWFKDTFDKVKKVLHEESLTGEYLNKQMTPKKFWKKFTSEITSNERLKKVDLIKDAIEVTDDIKGNKEVLAAVNRFNRTNSEIIEKMRDNTLGNALGDFIGAGVVTATLGAGLALEDNPEERKSKAINLGIPVGTTILGMIFGNALMLPAIKSMITGLALGQIGSVSAKMLDKPITRLSEEFEVKA